MEIILGILHILPSYIISWISNEPLLPRRTPFRVSQNIDNFMCVILNNFSSWEERWLLYPLVERKFLMLRAVHDFLEGPYPRISESRIIHKKPLRHVSIRVLGGHLKFELSCEEGSLSLVVWTPICNAWRRFQLALLIRICMQQNLIPHFTHAITGNMAEGKDTTNEVHTELLYGVSSFSMKCGNPRWTFKFKISESFLII